jgi:drug/metabolite transporter (DMT)-like permease
MKIVAGLLVAIVLDTALQLTWKSVVSGIPADMSSQSLRALAADPLFIALIIMMLCQFGNWIQLLGHADLSFAQPITSLSYISVLLLSNLYLDERIGPVQIAGVLFILLGVWFISRTNPKAARDE